MEKTIAPQGPPLKQYASTRALQSHITESYKLKQVGQASLPIKRRYNDYEADNTSSNFVTSAASSTVFSRPKRSKQPLTQFGEKNGYNLYVGRYGFTKTFVA